MMTVIYFLCGFGMLAAILKCTSEAPSLGGLIKFSILAAFWPSVLVYLVTAVALIYLSETELFRDDI